MLKILKKISKVMKCRQGTKEYAMKVYKASIPAEAKINEITILESLDH